METPQLFEGEALAIVAKWLNERKIKHNVDDILNLRDRLEKKERSIY